MPRRTKEDWASLRGRMVDRIALREELSERSLAALREVPRHRFVPARYRSEAYENHPLPIGLDQTISQPFMVAWLVDAVEASPGKRVLEIGTGCGYQAAVLAAAGARVWSIEIRRTLGERARLQLDALGLGAISIRIGDGALGWPEAAPFEGVVLTAAPESVPEALLAQVRVGGVLVAPVGPRDRTQELVRWRRISDDRWDVERLGGVRFVPFVDARLRPGSAD